MPVKISPRRIEQAMALAQQHGIEGSGIEEVIDRYIEAILSVYALREHAAKAEKRFEKRWMGYRLALLSIIDALGDQATEVFERPLALIAVAKGPQSSKVTDKNLLPKEYFNEPTPNIRKVTAALQAKKLVPGAVLTNPVPVLHIIPRTDPGEKA